MAAPLFGVAIAALVGGAVSLLSFGPGAGDYITRTIYDAFPSKIAGVADLIRSYKKGTTTKEQFYDLMRQNGFSQEQTDLISRSAMEQLNVGEIITLWFRFKDEPSNPFGVNAEWLSQRLQSAGIDPDSHKEAIEANRPVPTIQDVISFSQREAYEPAAVALGKLDEGLPEQYLKEAAKRGMSEDDARMFWRVHWNYPSLLQAFEMYQRLFDHPDPNVRFTEKELDTYYNIVDIAPGMRKRATAIAYRPVGRVDIRRFDRMGIYGSGIERRQKLIRAYRELGYDTPVAEQQTEFTIRLNDREDREFTRQQILELYRNGLPKGKAKEEAVKGLLALGYTQDKVDLTLQLEDRKIIDDEERKILDSVKAGIAAGRYKSDGAIRDALKGIDGTPEQINQIVRELKKEVEQERNPITTSKAEQLFRNKIIDEKEFRRLLEINQIEKDSIDALVKLNRPGSANEPALPPKNDVVKWYSEELIDSDLFVDKMKALQFDIDDIELYAIQAGRPLN